MKEIKGDDLKILKTLVNDEPGDDFKDGYLSELVWCECCKTKKRRSMFTTHKTIGGETIRKEHLLCSNCRVVDRITGTTKASPKFAVAGDVVCPAIIAMMEKRVKS